MSQNCILVLMRCLSPSHPCSLSTPSKNKQDIKSVSIPKWGWKLKGRGRGEADLRRDHTATQATVNIIIESKPTVQLKVVSKRRESKFV